MYSWDRDDELQKAVCLGLFSDGVAYLCTSIYHKSCLRAGCSSRGSVLPDMMIRQTKSNWRWPRETPAC